MNTKLIVLEDFVRRKYTNAIIIDWSLNAELLDCYKIKEKTNTYLLGVDYIVVRKPFKELSNLPKSQDRTEVLITLGSSDIRRLTASIANNIAIVHPDMRFHIVLGTKVGRKINSNIENIVLYENLDENNMAEVMHKCHIVISGGGQTLYELAVLNVKIIAIELIDNQEEELKSWNRIIYCWDV